MVEPPPSINFSLWLAGLQGAATTGQLPCRQSIPGKAAALSDREMCHLFLHSFNVQYQ